MDVGDSGKVMEGGQGLRGGGVVADGLGHATGIRGRVSSVHPLTASSDQKNRGMAGLTALGSRYGSMVGHKLLVFVLISALAFCVGLGFSCVDCNGLDFVAAVAGWDGLEGLGLCDAGMDLAGCETGQGVHVMVGGLVA